MLELSFWILLLRFLHRLLEYYWLVIAIIMGAPSCFHLVIKRYGCVMMMMMMMMIKLERR